MKEKNFNIGEIVREVSTAVKGEVLEINQEDNTYFVNFHDDESNMRWAEWRKETTLFSIGG